LAAAAAAAFNLFRCFLASHPVQREHIIERYGSQQLMHIRAADHWQRFHSRGTHAIQRRMQRMIRMHVGKFAAINHLAKQLGSVPVLCRGFDCVSPNHANYALV
jgi:hypothetical protein